MCVALVLACVSHYVLERGYLYADLTRQVNDARQGRLPQGESAPSLERGHDGAPSCVNNARDRAPTFSLSQDPMLPLGFEIEVERQLLGADHIPTTASNAAWGLLSQRDRQLPMLARACL